MWTAVEATPKRYGVVRFMEAPEHLGPGLCIAFATGLDALEEDVIGLCVLPTKPYKKRRPGVLIDLPVIGKANQIHFSSYFRLFLANATLVQFEFPQECFGNQFWFSLNMKMERAVSNTGVLWDPELLRFFDHFKPKAFIYSSVVQIIAGSPKTLAPFFQHPVVRSFEMLHIMFNMDGFKELEGLQAKDLFIGVASQSTSVRQRRMKEFLWRKIKGWLAGTDEIRKIQIWTGLHGGFAHIFENLTHKLSLLLTPEQGWIDRTYDGMHLILRASDGETLLVFWDTSDSCFYLLACNYNFRRGRCLGSYQQNQTSLYKIRNLLALYDAQNEDLSDRVKARLKEECWKFNKYNRDASEMDLTLDAIWRPKGKRHSPWRLMGANCVRDGIYPLHFELRHAYQFTKAYEARGVLPEPHEFKSATDEAIALAKIVLPQFYL
ncbi:unnamed protein product, partial [Mesorhabditis spiculigera]